jgi:hypothetical protein
MQCCLSQISAGGAIGASPTIRVKPSESRYFSPSHAGGHIHANNRPKPCRGSLKQHAQFRRLQITNSPSGYARRFDTLSWVLGYQLSIDSKREQILQEVQLFQY